MPGGESFSRIPGSIAAMKRVSFHFKRVSKRVSDAFQCYSAFLIRFKTESNGNKLGITVSIRDSENCFETHLAT